MQSLDKESKKMNFNVNTVISKIKPKHLKMSKIFLEIEMPDTKILTSCPCCRSENLEVLENLPKLVKSKFYEIRYKNDLSLMWCKNCYLYFKNFSVDHSVDEAIYASFNINAGKRWAKKIPNKFLDKISTLRKFEKVLEIGPGETPAAAHFPNANFYTLEMDPQHIVDDTKVGHHQFHGQVDKDLKFMEGKQFDAILAFDLFEHVNDVDKMFRNLHELLRPGGLLIFETGNCNSWAAKYFGIRWKYYSIPEHRVFFNEKSVLEICKRYDLTPIKIIFTRHKSLRSLWGLIRKCLATVKHLTFNPGMYFKDRYAILIAPELPVFKDHILCIISKDA